MVSRVMEEVQNQGVLAALGEVAQAALVEPLLFLHLELQPLLTLGVAVVVVRQTGWFHRISVIKVATAVLES